MTVQEYIDARGLTAFHLAEPDRTVAGGYCGDLLSWVMGRAGADCAWFTIMSNVNVAAVAALSDVSCVVLTEGVRPDEALLAKAAGQGINLLGTEESAFAGAVALGGLLQQAE